MKEHNWIKTALTPLSWLYGLITDLRNLLYDLEILPSKKPVQYTICVGNLTVGGTGKTPMTEYLARLLLTDFKIAILSRGYGRKTKGFLLAGNASSAAEIGDEPLQYFTKFREKIVVAVSENRVEGAKKVNLQHPEINMLLLDDAYQHRAIIPDIKLLLNDFNRPFYGDLPFPAGRLRETRYGARRADAVVITKCPKELSVYDKDAIAGNVHKYTHSKIPVFFSSVKYAEPVGYRGGPVQLKNVKLVAGIANPDTFVGYMRQQFNVIDEIILPDHHNYSSDDLEGLIKYLKNDTFVVTTEKDMVKLKPMVEKAGATSLFAYVPIAVDFGNDTGKFNEWILQQIQKPPLEPAAL